MKKNNNTIRSHHYGEESSLFNRFCGRTFSDSGCRLVHNNSQFCSKGSGASWNSRRKNRGLENKTIKNPKIGGLHSSPSFLKLATSQVILLLIFLLFLFGCGSRKKSEPVISEPEKVIVEKPVYIKTPVIKEYLNPCLIPDSLDCYLYKSRDFMKRKRFDDSIEILDEAILKYRSNPELKVLLGESLFRTGSIERAKVILEQALILDSSNSHADYLLTEINRLIISPPPTITIWFLIHKGVVSKAICTTPSLRGSLVFERVERVNNQVHIYLISKFFEGAIYRVIIRNSIPDGQHFFTGRLQ